MIKKIFQFCKVTIVSAPIYFIVNVGFVLLMALSWFAANYSSRLLVNSIITAQSTHKFSFYVVFPSILFFLGITLGGNYFNFQDMLVSIYTRKSRKFFGTKFLYKSYKTRQDKFYDNNFYNDYEFVKNNIGAASDITVSIFNNLIMSIFSAILSSIAIAVFDLYILIGIIILALGITFLNKYLVRKKIELNKSYVKDERKAAYFKELLSERKHTRELRIFKLRELFLRKWEESYRTYSKAKFCFEIKAELLSSIVGLLQIIMEKGITIYFVYMVFNGSINAGDCVFLITLVASLSRGIGNIADILSSEINEKYQYADKYYDFVNNLSTDKLISGEYKENNLCYGDFKELRLTNVSYKYPHSTEASLKNINFSLRKGEVVSILGYNGSGKSTLSKVICGLLEDYTGDISLNGKEFSKLDNEEIYKYFGIAFQDFSKYSISLKENIAVGMVEGIENDDEVSKAIKKGNLNALIEKLPNKEGTILGKEYDKEGQDLSGGQWQRIILSRAYMGEPEILILDEPTASIDPIEEMRMLNQFKEIIKGKTAILISHRIGFARLCSRICIMESGRLVEEGSHEELIKLKGRYYELFTSQKQLYEEEVS
ncbi:ABC transporter ATP-binding protein [Clostridium sp. YIM B02515]|uniref:ABC transporter ATP-binding protein n=1 Tax=Clostridium rhizosphaerae TaxID=2803861 RepID=A0ABS1TDA0_9CLOT|nr:ABC transporter ATP-binding protein [Clostridium rhizosphaerae]MBL4937335.1 ABC transporter ATP-binding protein [Clostridium rhizosphaerae]